MLDLLSLNIGLDCALDELGTLVEKLHDKLLNFNLVSSWPVFTEALHLLEKRCRLSGRRDYVEKLSAIKAFLTMVNEETIALHEALQRLAPGIDLADAALIGLLEKSQGLYTLLTHDYPLARLARRQGLQALTTWELLSLLGD